MNKDKNKNMNKNKNNSADTLSRRSGPHNKKAEQPVLAFRKRAETFLAYRTTYSARKRKQPL